MDNIVNIPGQQTVIFAWWGLGLEMEPFGYMFIVIYCKPTNLVGFLSVADTAFSKRVVMVNSRYWEPKGTLCSHYE